MTQSLLGELVLHDAEAGVCAFYSWRNIVIACWSKQATGPTMLRFARIRENLDREHPEGVSVVYLIANGAGLPTEEARVVAGELMERYRHKRAALAVVVFGEGFWASAMRAANTGVQAQLRSSVRLRTSNDVKEVVSWLPEQHEDLTGVRIAPEELRCILESLAAKLAP